MEGKLFALLLEPMFNRNTPEDESWWSVCSSQSKKPLSSIHAPYWVIKGWI